ncbi:phosphatase PAP2 family protein [Flavobacterium zepuense]|uniref:Phosphatase PAP2 family protein n=1 Tax=Flavobacterium zepuense TaxID=2593302 RepID=A0A552VA20_9FLAO|nr:phosphatase PAP2 family protein [Flavobacterium zepuense]TRW27328.1 phosphatase PAP2 family protein [Flavobacterium zepuense]
MIRQLSVIVLFLNMFTAYGQLVPAQNDSINDSNIEEKGTNDYKFRYKQLIIPGAFIAYGAIGLNSTWIKSINRDIRSRVRPGIDSRLTIDDFSRYVPVATVYGLNLAGVQGKHNFKDRTVIILTSLVLVNVTVASLKEVVHVRRPDGTSNDSFPSGHTTSAFAGAEFLYQEYKDVSVWYGIGGYAIAAGTGIFRIYNDRHWFTDVITGAGIGILGTKAAYWMHPFIQRTLFGSKEKNNTKVSGLILPFYNGQQVGLAVSAQF